MYYRIFVSTDCGIKAEVMRTAAISNPSPRFLMIPFTPCSRKAHLSREKYIRSVYSYDDHDRSARTYVAIRSSLLGAGGIRMVIAPTEDEIAGLIDEPRSTRGEDVGRCLFDKRSLRQYSLGDVRAQIEKAA